MFVFGGFALLLVPSGGIAGRFGGNNGVSRVTNDGVAKRLRAALPVFTTETVTSVANPRRQSLPSTSIDPGGFQPDDAEIFDVSADALGFQRFALINVGTRHGGI